MNFNKRNDQRYLYANINRPTALAHELDVVQRRFSTEKTPYDRAIGSQWTPGHLVNKPPSARENITKNRALAEVAKSKAVQREIHPGENMNYSNQMKGQNKKTILHGSPDYNNKNPKKVVAKNPIGYAEMIAANKKSPHITSDGAEASLPPLARPEYSLSDIMLQRRRHKEEALGKAKGGLTEYDNSYRKPEAKLEKPTLNKERYQEEFNTDPRFLSESKPPFDNHPEKSPLWLGPRKYCDEILGLYNEAETTIDGGKRLPLVRTISQEHELLMEQMEKDKQLHRWKAWQYHSMPQLLHKYPSGLVRLRGNQDLPWKPGDLPHLPYKHKKHYLRVLRYRHTDQFQKDSDTRAKILGLRVNNFSDGGQIQEYLRS